MLRYPFISYQLLANNISISAYQNIFSKQHNIKKTSFRQNYAATHNWMNYFPMPIYTPRCIQFLCPQLTQTNVRSRFSFVWKTRPIRINTQCLPSKRDNYRWDQYKIFISDHKQIARIPFRSGTHCETVHSLASLHKKGTATE